ncbi:MAG: hypothetical protein EP329_18885 [Deltaproteobacteria bacterium]|nr:MAG: hypothetical protein EP329_18885 [Deltaproteobacteria bacterium]
MAALNLQGVADVVWDLEVLNGDGQTVWQQRISSTQYGDSAGSASYVGPCDAAGDVAEPGVCDPTLLVCTNAHLAFPGDYATATTPCAVATQATDCAYTINYNMNDVNVYVVGVYDTAVTSPGAFGAIQPQIADLVPFQNPTWDDVVADNIRGDGDTITPLNRNFECKENQDVFVQFDVALMRPAQQGFFDIAVNFNSIFCSAKFDCAYEAAAAAGSCSAGACAAGTFHKDYPLTSTCTADSDCVVRSDINLLHTATSGRSTTFVLGFACTAGADTATTGTGDRSTQLYLDNLTLYCGADGADTDTLGDTIFYINTSQDNDGNLCTAGSMGACDNVSTTNNSFAGSATHVAAAGTYFYQAAVYSGSEQLPATTGSYNKAYWNVALGVIKPAATAAATKCTLRTKGTADDPANFGDLVYQNAIANGAVYPYLEWDIDFATCGAEPLMFGVTDAMVSTAYTGTTLEDRDGDNVIEATNQPWSGTAYTGSGNGEDDLYFDNASAIANPTN